MIFVGNISSTIKIKVGSVIRQNCSSVDTVIGMVLSGHYHSGQHLKCCIHAGNVTALKVLPILEKCSS